MVIILVAISIGVSLSLVFVVLGCFQCFAGKRSRGFSNFENPDEESAHATRENAGFSLGPSDLVTVDSSAFTSVTIEPLPDILAKSISTSALRPRIRCIEKSKQESALRLITVHHPFPRVQLTYLKEIGSTWFGQVIESDAEKITGVARNRVIVKVLSDNASTVEQKQFLEDVAPYRELDHTNVIRLLGQCTEATPLLLVLEFAPLGDLKSYLRNNKTGSAMFTQKNLQIKFALDVASGLACLHGHSYIHHDLAARTCLVAGDLTVKIGDYGICEDKYKADYYNNGQELLPLRWMAPESLELQDSTWQITKISKECNIWTYGVLLWEIMTYANRPYATLHDGQVLDDVIKQKLIKLKPPDSAIPYKDRVFEVMQFCWLKSEQRPQVEEVHGLLQRLYEQTSQSETGEDQFEKKWDSLIPQEAQIPRQDNICVNSKEPHKFESDFIASNETTSITSDEYIGKNSEKFSTTVDGGLDFSPSLPVNGISKQELPSTPIRPIREHFTSTPLTKDNNFENNLQNKPVRNIEAIMKTEDVATMNDSLLDDEAFENDSKPEDYQQTETFVTSADTVTSGVVTGDFSLSDKHSEKMMLSSPLSIPSLQIEEIQLKTKENLFIPQSSSDAINNPEKVSERLLPDLLEKYITEATNEKDKVAEGQCLRKKTDDNIEIDITSNNNKLILDYVDVLSDLNDGNLESTTDPDNTTRLSNSFSDFVEISNNLNPLTSGDINSTLGADIDEFMNASFDSPNNLSDDKSVDNLTDFSELDLILSGKTNSELSSYNESLDESNLTVGKTSNSPKTTPINDATNQVGSLMNNECKVFLNLNVNQRLEVCDIKSSTPVNNFTRYSRTKNHINHEQVLPDDSLVNGACSPVVNDYHQSSSTSDDDDDDSSASSGDSYVCEYNVNDIEIIECEQNEVKSKLKVEGENSDSDSDCEEFSMNEEDIIFASELYRSKGINSPSVFEKTPLETIPEDDLTSSPKELESLDIKFEGHYDDVFNSQDNFEWDDFMGESLVGRPRSSDMSPKRALDFSDWMVEDDISLRSNSSSLSNSKNVNGVRSSVRSDFNSAGSFDYTSNRSSISESEVKRSHQFIKPRSYISELISNRSTGSLTSNYKKYQTNSFYSLYDNMDLEDSTNDENGFTDLHFSNESQYIGLDNSYVGNAHDIASKSNVQAASGTNKVFEATVMTTDLDEDLPPLTDNNTNFTENTDTISHNL